MADDLISKAEVLMLVAAMQTDSIAVASPIATNRKIREAITALPTGQGEGRITTLFPAIAHGDQEHRDWLEKAIADHFAGSPVLVFQRCGDDGWWDTSGYNIGPRIHPPKGDEG